jgi:TRAP-type transport system periplasmic protein
MIRPSVRVILIGLIVAVTLIAGACGNQTVTSTPVNTSVQPTGSTSQTPVAVIKLKMGSPNSPLSPTELANQRWIDKIKKETNGQVEIMLYSAGTLVDAFAAWDSLKAGVADITAVSNGLPGTPFKITEAFNWFVYGTDIGGARYAFETLLKKYPEMTAEYAGVHRLFSQGGTDQYIHSKKPIRTLADFKGLQMQPPPGATQLFTKLGATGTFMPGADMYTSLDKGIIDGVSMPAETLKSNNLADITKYSTNTHLPGIPGTVTCMNIDSWNKLPPDIQKILDDSIAEMNDDIEKTLIDASQEAIDYAKSKGHEFIELSPEDMNTLNSYIEEIALNQAKALDAKGLPGTAIFKDARALIEEYNQNHKS